MGNRSQRAFFSGATRGNNLADFEMVWVRRDKEDIPLEMSYSPVCNTDGKLIAGRLIARDITERYRAAQHAAMMLAELNHRVKNTLATVQAIARAAGVPHADAGIVGSDLPADAGELERIVEAVIAGNARSVEEFRAGKDKAFNALVGQAMKASKGKADPAEVGALLRSKLG